MKLRVALAAAVLGPACTSPDAPPRGVRVAIEVDCPELPPDAQRHVVLVRVAGLDPRLPVFRGKIAGCYTVVCDGPTHPLATAVTKDEHLAGARVQDTECRLRKGITVVRSSTFEALADAREDWNRRVFAKSVLEEHPSVADIAQLLSGEGVFDYQGTAVASAIAFDNPDVRLVFVEPARATSKPPCPSPATLAQQTAALADPTVRAALAGAPVPRLTEELAAVMRARGVTLVHESLAAHPTAAWERDCPELPLRALAGAAAAVAADRRAFLATTVFAGLDLLTIKAAGNYALPLATDVDSASCIRSSFGASSADLMIGAYGWSGSEAPTRSAFTSTGACVHAYAPGELVIAGAPEQWYAPWNGTTLAAPLVTRWLTKTRPASDSAATLRDAVLAAIEFEEGGLLPRELFDARMLTQTPGAVITRYE